MPLGLPLSKGTARPQPRAFLAPDLILPLPLVLHPIQECGPRCSFFLLLSREKCLVRPKANAAGPTLSSEIPWAKAAGEIDKPSEYSDIPCMGSGGSSL